MEIIWFTENYPPNKGGMARSCDRIVTSLRKHHTVHVFHFTNKVEAFSTTVQIGGSYTALPIYEDFAFTLNVTWSFAKNNVLIKNAACFVSYGSNLCQKGVPLFAQWLNKFYVTCFRGNDFDTAIFSPKRQDVLYAITHANAIACVTKEKVSRIKKLALNDAIYYTPNAIAISEWEILEADKKLAAKIKTTAVQENKQVIGLVGYLKQKKGISFLIDAIKHSYLKEKLHFHVVGTIDESLALMMEEAELSYAITSPDSRTSLIANYVACDAVLIPSIYDGMPNVLFEAGVLKIPIIASNAGGIQDVLNKENAYVFDVLSKHGLLEQLETFLNASSENRHQKVTQLYNHIKEKYTPEKEIAKYLEIFDGLK